MSDAIARRLIERGYALAAPRSGVTWSGIVSFSHSRHRHDDLDMGLTRSGVIVSLREGLARVASHFYNDETDIAPLSGALPEGR